MVAKARVVRCDDCQWTGRRWAHANRRPCRNCGSRRVFLSGRPPGRPTADTVRVRVQVPREWLDVIPAPIAPTIRNYVRERLEAEGKI